MPPTPSSATALPRQAALSQPSDTPATRGRPADGAGFFGHPRGLSTLFFTEMWERFSYYGMRALLILFMTTPTTAGGLGFGVAEAGALYGLYTAAVYLAALPGGWIGDRLWGQQRSVLVGGVLIAAGHFTLAFPGLGSFYSGLALIVVGTGLLKPNISTIVGQLYSRDDARRDAGFSIFYMGINLGGFLAPLVCGYLGENVAWHWGFSAAGFGMVLGLVQYVAGRRHLAGAGCEPVERVTEPVERRRLGALALVSLVVLVVGVVATVRGWLPFGVVEVANSAVILIASAAAIFFFRTLADGRLSRGERWRVGAVAVLFLFSTLFWMGFEQGGSSLNLFARDMTDRLIGGWEFPASWFQFVNSAFVIVLVPVFAVLWVKLGSRQPSVPMKFGLGLVLLGSGFGVLTVAASLAQDGVKVGLGWLVAAYFLHTCGELCLSPVGLSTVTRLAPERLTGQMMGVWFISISLGNLIAGLVAGSAASLSMGQVFLAVFGVTAVAGVVLMVSRRPVVRLMAGD